jgi:hypothetical protein
MVARTGPSSRNPNFSRLSGRHSQISKTCSWMSRGEYGSTRHRSHFRCYQVVCPRELLARRLNKAVNPLRVGARERMVRPSTRFDRQAIRLARTSGHQQPRRTTTRHDQSVLVVRRSRRGRNREAHALATQIQRRRIRSRLAARRSLRQVRPVRRRTDSWRPAQRARRLR